jgi:predicted ATPase
VRIGVHTGPVVVGEIGTGEHTERLALGETPNLAARIQGQAEPNTVVIRQATYRLVHGFFRCESLGPQNLKNVSAPLELYRVHGEEVSVQKGLTPLVGREAELGVLRQRWEQTTAGAGQVVLLSGEPGIGKSRLVQELKEQVSAAGVTRIEFHCSPYHQNTALYPITEHLQRLLQFQSIDTPHTKLTKLAQLLSQYRFPQTHTLPLLAALFSLPPPAGAPPLSFSPQQQKQLTLEALVAWLLEEAERAVVYCAWEDLHWADPSTLEILTLFLDQVATARVLALLTFRPEFSPPWGNRSHISRMTLSRLGRQHVETMIERVTGGKALPADVMQQNGLKQLVEAELVYQRGLLPQARYIFKHALIQDTAYQSLLKSRR